MAASPDTVVLVHGLWLHGTAMGTLRRRLARAGYRALAYSYPSMRLTLAENAERLARYCTVLGVPRLDLVCHSLGGVVALRALEQVPALPVGRIVLAGVPFRGSYAARRFARLPGGRAALGRSVREWLAEERAAPGVAREVGVIAGSRARGLGRLVAPGMPRPCDGVVSVAETVVPGMRDHIVLDVSHSGMLFSGAVARQVRAFLRDGAFARDEGGRMKAAG
ncbi:MAG: alpha/beta hydrolase [Burkholderiales bacterium]|nr:alpha/beta hydrolase [Burkholderiales bacterium]